MYLFGAIVRPDGDGGFWAEVPDLPGCYGQGDTEVECVQSMSNGLETHLAAMLADGLEIPKPSLDFPCEDGRVVFFDVEPNEYTLNAETVSAAEASRMLGVTPGRVSQLIRANKLKAHKGAAGTEVTVLSISEYQKSGRRAGRPRKLATV